MPLFVIQEHHASTLHYDFRLEKDGVLKSWAVPKGVPQQKGVKHLAVAVEDHDLAYAGFEGIIPKGEYGAGQVILWDSGSYEEESWGSDKLVFRLHGNKLTGRYCLIRFKKAGDNQWLIFAL